VGDRRVVVAAHLEQMAADRVESVVAGQLLVERL